MPARTGIWSSFMAFLLSSERPAVAAASRSPVVVIARWLAKARAERQQRLAMRQLLLLDDARLEDLGLTRRDVRGAMERHPRQAGLHLSRTRARRASLWLRRTPS
jgi:uncharacterized protein YjiS (DUF1127 family)